MAEWLALPQRRAPLYLCGFDTAAWLASQGHFIGLLGSRWGTGLTLAKRTWAEMMCANSRADPQKLSASFPSSSRLSLFPSTSQKQKGPNPGRKFRVEGAGCSSNKCPHWTVA